MTYEWWIASRYLWSRRRHPFVGVISVISVLGVCVGVAALLVVSAVMNGFDEDLKVRIIGVRAHLVVEKEGVFSDYEGILQKLKSASGIAGVSPYIEGQALIETEGWSTGVLVRGVDPERERGVSQFHRYLTQGTLSGEPRGVVVGSELAKKAHLGLGSEIRVLTQVSKKPSRYRVEGFFSSGLYDYDANLIFLSLSSAQTLFQMDGRVSGLSAFLKDAQKADEAKKAIQAELGFPYFVRTWMDLNRTLFGALKLEKLVMFLILVLIILVACLNIAGSLTILVMDKTKDIGVLKALGAPPVSLVKIFALGGLLIGLAGAGSGLGLGLGLCAFLKNNTWVQLPKEVYFVDRLPVLLNLTDALAVVATAVALSFVSAIYPATMAGKLDPVRALRYE